jgi:hypothetical protein
MSDTSDNFGSYLAGRFAGKMSASVEAKGELDRERRIAVRAIEIGKEHEATLKGYVMDVQAVRLAELSHDAGRWEVLKRISAESKLVAAHLEKYGNISQGEYETLAPLTAERRHQDVKLRVETSAVYDEAARAYLGTDEAWNALIGCGLTETECKRILERARNSLEKSLVL